jgi:excinuclease UvrABC ATPase subunit
MSDAKYGGTMLDYCQKMVAAGSPEELARHPESHTGRYLRKLLH